MNVYLLAEAVWKAKQCPCIEQISKQGHWLIDATKHIVKAFTPTWRAYINSHSPPGIIKNVKHSLQPACFHEYIQVYMVKYKMVVE